MPDCFNIYCTRRAVPGAIYCSSRCENYTKRRLSEARQEVGKPKPTLSVSAGWSALANESATYDAFFDRMMPERANLPPRN